MLVYNKHSLDKKIVFHVHAMNANRRSRGTARLILYLGNTWRFTPRLESRYPLIREWVGPSAGWKLRKKLLSLRGFETWHRPIHSIVSVQAVKA
jgi:hypothetical protein